MSILGFIIAILAVGGSIVTGLRKSSFRSEQEQEQQRMLQAQYQAQYLEQRVEQRVDPRLDPRNDRDDLYRSRPATFRNGPSAAPAPLPAAADNASDNTALPEEDDLHLLQPSVHMDLTEMQESVHESMHELHETVHVRRTSSAPAVKRKQPAATGQVAFPAGGKLSKADLARALVLGEVLGEPRAKRPWRPKTRR